MTVTVKNFDSWCNVSVDGDPGGPFSEQTVCVTPGSVVDVSAVAARGFQIGTTPWHHTDGDTGPGEQGTLSMVGIDTQSATTVTVMSKDVCVWVCCEFDGGGGCNVPDQCP